MLAKRIIPCLDVRAGKVTKGVQFLANVDVGDPVAMARYYYEEGADELVFYDITASNERRGIMIDVVRAVAREIFIPFSVGGGLRTLEEMRAVLLAGAEKVSIDSGAVRNPALITEGARAFGSQCVVLSMQVKRSGNAQCPSGCEVMIDGGRTPTGRDALQWACEGERLGAGELCINSIDRDGTRLGYDLEITRRISGQVSIPVIASGGAGEPRHLLEAFTGGLADAAIVASIVHYGEHPIPQLKRYLRENGVEMREAVSLEKERTVKIAVVVSDFNADVTSVMLERARRHAEFLGVEVSQVVHVPGVFDMPLMIRRLLKRKDVDGVVIIGAVIKGETLHDELICGVTARAASELALQFDKPVGLGVTGPGMTLMQAMERVDNAKNAVEAVVRMLRLLKQPD